MFPRMLAILVICFLYPTHIYANSDLFRIDETPEFKEEIAELGNKLEKSDMAIEFLWDRFKNPSYFFYLFEKRDSCALDVKKKVVRTGKFLGSPRKVIDLKDCKAFFRKIEKANIFDLKTYLYSNDLSTDGSEWMVRITKGRSIFRIYRANPEEKNLIDLARDLADLAGIEIKTKDLY